MNDEGFDLSEEVSYPLDPEQDPWVGVPLDPEDDLRFGQC
jgi:hypothetical protein